jgi:hypothetical protein
MIHAVKVELITPGSIAQPIIVKAPTVPPKRTRSNKRARKNKNNVMASIAAFLVVSFLIILSQMDCFNIHSGFSKLVTDTQITHSANGSYMDMHASAGEVQLDAACCSTESACRVGRRSSDFDDVSCRDSQGIKWTYSNFAARN